MNRSLYLELVIWCLTGCHVVVGQDVINGDWFNPPIVETVAKSGSPPSDAIVLLETTDLSAFAYAADWKKSNGFVSVAGKSKFIETKRAFGDCQLHVEFATPPVARGEGQFRGNSGLYLMGLYEVQILDSFDNKTYPEGQCGALYFQHPPAVNASLEAGKWQTYEIAFTAPRFEENGELRSPARITVFQNGVLVQNQVAFKGPTDLREKTRYSQHAAKLPLRIQNHGNPVRFRNIWIRENVSARTVVEDDAENQSATLKVAQVKSDKDDYQSESSVDQPGWNSLLDEKLTRWEKFLGVPHPTVRGLPKDIPTSENFKVGVPIGVRNDFPKVFTARVVDGESVVRISGEVYGALTSKKEYSNYHLRMQFRWGDRKFIPRLNQPRDSGLLYHCVGAHGAYASSWMTSVECQIMEKDYGDLFCLGNASAEVMVNEVPQNTRPLFTPGGTLKRLKIARRLKDHGHPKDWNTVEVMTLGNDAIHLINGHVVNVIRNARLGDEGTGKPMARGKIQIQSEGAELFVRRVEIRPMTEFPEEPLARIGLNQRLDFVGRATGKVSANVVVD